MFGDAWLIGHYVDGSTQMRRIQRILADKNNKNFIGVHRLNPPYPRHTFGIVA
jgi:hypothetical protein